jgi:hypothetical protein
MRAIRATRTELRLRTSLAFLVFLSLAVIAIGGCKKKQPSTKQDDDPYSVFYGPDGRIGCKGTEGKVIVPAKYDSGRVCAKLFERDIRLGENPPDAKTEIGTDWVEMDRNGKIGYLDGNLNEVVPPQFDLTGAGGGVYWGMILVRENGKFGYVAAKSRQIWIQPEYEGADNFEFTQGLPGPMASVKKNGKWGFINRRNEVQIPFQFDDAVQFWFSSDDSWQENFESKTDLLTEPGSVPNPAQAKPWTWVKVGKLWGVIDSSGNVLMGPSKPSDQIPPVECDTRMQRCYGVEQMSEGEFTRREKAGDRPHRYLLPKSPTWDCKPPNQPTNPNPVQDPWGHVVTNIDSCVPRP